MIKVLPVFLGGLLFFRILQAQVYPPPACIEYINGSLIICPPDSIPDYSGGLLGYNIQLDGEFFDFHPVESPDDTLIISFDPLPLPGSHVFCAASVYQAWISDFICDSTLVYYGHELPFLEDWSSGSLETNSWISEGVYWNVTGEIGDPAPSVNFQGNYGLTNYFVPLTSDVFIADSLNSGRIKIGFDVKLECINQTGNEKLLVQFWDWVDQAWTEFMFPLLTNANGSFDWTRYDIWLDDVSGTLFKVRFVAEGTNSADISAWYIDNISLRRTCPSPSGLNTHLNGDGQVELEWDDPTCGEPYYYWLFHCSGITFTSVGTGNQVEFDVAARFTPSILAQHDTLLSQVSFYPAETDASYRIRIWVGDSATLVYEQEVIEPQIGELNHISLAQEHPIDVTQSLWIGYHIESNTGWPAGADQGPAYDGFGNMIYWEDQWVTLLDLNPELNYNWTIIGYVGGGDPLYCGNRIYRKINDGYYFLIDNIPINNGYVDEEADPADMNCYMVTHVQAKDWDTCESDYSNESCQLPVMLGENQNNQDQLIVYPNPARDQLFIEMKMNIIEIQLLDMTGRVIFENRNAGNKLTIQTKGFSKGIFLLKVHGVENIVTRKILII